MGSGGRGGWRDGERLAVEGRAKGGGGAQWREAAVEGGSDTKS
jgi:hypothetical protein